MQVSFIKTCDTFLRKYSEWPFSVGLQHSSIVFAVGDRLSWRTCRRWGFFEGREKSVFLDFQNSNPRSPVFRIRWQTFLAVGLPVLASVGTFLVYSASGFTLEPAQAFVSVGLFELLNVGLGVLPACANEVRSPSTL